MSLNYRAFCLGRTIKGSFFSQVIAGFLTGSMLWAAPADPAKKPAQEKPGVETKIKQVPGEGSHSTPLWKGYWEKARGAVLLNQYNEAVRFFRQALALKPNLDEARLELARVLESQEKWGEAIGELEVLADHQPLNIKIQKELADLFSRQKEYRRASERYLWILQKEPENLPVRLALARNFFEVNELEKALIEWRQVLIRDPQNTEARLQMVEALIATRRLDESIQILDYLVKHFPKQSGLKRKMAQALVLAQKFKEALPYLQELNRQDPVDLEVQLMLAQVLAAVRNYDQSLPYLETYLKKKPDNSSALLEKARALLNTGHAVQAMEIYERLKKMDGNNTELLREMAEAYVVSGKLKEAILATQHLIQHFPNEYQLHEKAGTLYLQLREYGQAIAPFQNALALDPDNPFAQLGLARAYHFSGQREKALPLYRSLLQQREDPGLKVELADLLYETGKFSEAFAYYNQVLTEKPDLWEVRFKLATGYYRQKEFPLAAQQLERLVREQPEQGGIWTLVGYNALEQGDYGLAQQAFRRVLLLGQDRGNILLRLGETYRLQGYPWKGLTYLDWALEIQPGDKEILIEKAMALIDGGGFAQAQRILEAVNNKSPDSFKVRRAGARLLAAQGRRDESEAAWTALEKAFPSEQALIFQDRAAFYASQQKWGPALTALKAAQIKNPLNLDIQKKIGRLLVRMGLWAEAESFYLDLDKKKILLDEAYLGLGLIHIRGNRPEPAQEMMWQALCKAPESIPIRFWLMRGYGHKKEMTRAAGKIEETLLQFSRSQEGGLLALADAYQEAGDWKKAYPLYREVLEKGEDDELLQAAFRISAVLLPSGEIEEVKELFEDLQKRFPRNQKVARTLIQVYSQDKEYGQAIRVIDQLYKQEDPKDPVLTWQKARLLEKWHKHSSSQATYSRLLEPPVDHILSARLEAWLPKADPAWQKLIKELTAQEGYPQPYGLFERTVKILDYSETGESLQPIREFIEILKVLALIQKKTYLEMEGKDLLWKGLFFQARVPLEELKDLDPDHEEAEQDLVKSYRLQN